MDEHSDASIEQRIDQLTEKIKEQSDQWLKSSSLRTAQELRRLTRAEQRVIPCLYAMFRIVNLSQATLNSELGRSTSIELIALLESEDQARRLQPDLPEAEYEETRAWMTACGYDNLALHTARLQGFNSEGMQACINDGIHVCRRTGKTQCIACFREYASVVHLAADDIDMAENFARQVATLPPQSAGNERRWVGAQTQAELLLMRGQVEAAEQAFHTALALATTYHEPQASRLETLTALHSLLLVAGREPEFAPFAEELQAARQKLPAGEWLEQELRWGHNDALAAICQGEFDAAIEGLTAWDRQLTELRSLSHWFEIRLRLLAALRLAGQPQRLPALAKPLEAKARAASDYLTLRRLERLLDETLPLSPLALTDTLTSGPFSGRTTNPSTAIATAAATAATASQASELQPPPAAASSDADSLPGSKTGSLVDSKTDAAAGDSGGDSADDSGEVSKPTPSDVAKAEASRFADSLTPAIAELGNRLTALLPEANEHQPELDAQVQEILAWSPGAVKLESDASALIYWLSLIDHQPQSAAPIWNWAQAVASRFPQTATLLNVLATLGTRLRESGGEEVNALIPVERLASLFRKSLELDSGRARNFSRAGLFYYQQEDLGEAERCFARGFRLDRSNSQVAMQLAALYRSTDRPRDSLAVLDLNLRQGRPIPEVLWAAAMQALTLDEYESMLSYLDKFVELVPDQPWSHYYRGLALLDLNRPQEVLEAADREATQNHDLTFPLEILRACACDKLGQPAACRLHIANVLAVPLRSILNMTQTGIFRLFARLWQTVEPWPATDVDRQAIDERLLISGAAPNELFTPDRRANPETDVNFYRCVLLQPLDERWKDFPGCLASQEDWENYLIEWGVLASSEAQAGELALKWQSRCYYLPPSVAAIEEEDSGYTDHAGIVWQGGRWNPADEGFDGETLDDNAFEEGAFDESDFDSDDEEEDFPNLGSDD